MNSFAHEIGRLLNDPNFFLDVRPEWRSSASNGHRLKIREALAERLHDPGLLDLSKLPANESSSVSISHCPLAGGYALGSPNATLGFDLEDATRVRPAVVARVSLAHELTEAPSVPLLWTAKESAFKALRGVQQPAVVSELKITGWRTALSSIEPISHQNLWVFEALHSSRNESIAGNGVTLQLGNLIYAFFSRIGST